MTADYNQRFSDALMVGGWFQERSRLTIRDRSNDSSSCRLSQVREEMGQSHKYQSKITYIFNYMYVI